jgi:hypothetical protein
MLELGIIRPSNSPYQSNLLFVPKKGSSELRPCIDFRALNAITVTEQFPLPRIDDIVIVDGVGHSQYFSKIDLKSGYWQVRLDEASIPFTAFSTPTGHFEFVRLPFGLKNAPGGFMLRMQRALADLRNIACYIDDIIPHSQSFRDHEESLRLLFARVRELGLKLNPKKCVFGLTSLDAFGFVLGQSKVRIDPERVQALDKLHVPTSVSELRRFLGLIGYFRRFIPRFSALCAPLYKLLQKDVDFAFNDECHENFVKLKELLKSDAILITPDFRYPFKLYTDASGCALGAILTQELAGAERVIAYASCCLTVYEKNYSFTDMEC